MVLWNDLSCNAVRGGNTSVEMVEVFVPDLWLATSESPATGYSPLDQG